MLDIEASHPHPNLPPLREKGLLQLSPKDPELTEGAIVDILASPRGGIESLVRRSDVL